MTTGGKSPAPQRIAIIGGGIAGLGAAWALHHHPDRFDFRLFEAQDRIGGNAVTVDMPQDDGSSIPFDISVTALIPSVYQHVLLLMKRFGIEVVTPGSATASGTEAASTRTTSIPTSGSSCSPRSPGFSGC